MIKSIKELSWQVDEETYRANPAISYSALATYAREGHRCVPTLYDRKESEALRFGSLVDTLLTEPESVDAKFFFADFPSLSEAMLRMVKSAFTLYGSTYRSIDKIPFDHLLGIVNTEGYSSNWKDETRVNDLIKKGKEYYGLLYLSTDKILMSSEDKAKAVACVDTFNTHIFTRYIFEQNPFDTDIEKHFQLKFILEDTEKYSLPSPIRCMFDLLVVDHINKVVQPYDIKTTGKNESDFAESFIQWNYYLQATMYSYILFKKMKEDNYFKQFTLAPFSFIVINRNNLTPLVWSFSSNLSQTNWVDNNGKSYKGWRKLLSELSWHLITGKYEYPIEAYHNAGRMKIESLKQVTDSFEEDFA